MQGTWRRLNPQKVAGVGAHACQPRKALRTSINNQLLKLSRRHPSQNDDGLRTHLSERVRERERELFKHKQWLRERGVQSARGEGVGRIPPSRTHLPTRLVSGVPDYGLLSSPGRVRLLRTEVQELDPTPYTLEGDT